MLPESALADAFADCRAKSARLAVAESCASGFGTIALTVIGCFAMVMDRAFVTCSSEAKHEMIGVPVPLIQQHRAASEPVAKAMAKGALSRSRAVLAVWVAGLAGAGGGTFAKPVGWSGLAWCAWVPQHTRSGTPSKVIAPRSRAAIVLHTLRMIQEAI